MDPHRGRKRGGESKGNSEIRPPLSTLDPSHGKEVVLQRPLGEHSSLDPSTCTEEKRSSVRTLPHEFVRECQSRIKVAPGAASGENHDWTLMHGPSFPRDGASRSPERCS